MKLHRANIYQGKILVYWWMQDSSSYGKKGMEKQVEFFMKEKKQCITLESENWFLVFSQAFWLCKYRILGHFDLAPTLLMVRHTTFHTAAALRSWCCLGICHLHCKQGKGLSSAGEEGSKHHLHTFCSFSLLKSFLVFFNWFFFVSEFK